MRMNDLTGKRLLLMGGMQISCEIVKQAHKMGIVVGVADYYSADKSPAKRIADFHYEVSITDVDAVVELVKREQYDGVIVGFNDMLLPYYAQICEKAGLPCYGTQEQFEILIAKDRYKALCRQFGVPTIKEYAIDDPDIQYPVLIKPTDSSGSRGITICRNAQELAAAVEQAKRFSKTEKFLIERYMDGQEVTVFWIFQDGEYYVSALGNRHVKQGQGDDIIPLPVGYTFPSNHLQKYLEEVAPCCKRMFRHLGILDGMMFMQCKVEDGTCYVYDLGFRLTGSQEYKIIERVCGYDPMAMMIHFALTGSMGEADLAKKANPMFAYPAFNVSCLCAPCTIQRIEGIEQVQSMQEVLDAVVAHPVGDTITPEMRGLLAQITIRILGVAESKEHLWDTIKKIYKPIAIIGTDEMNHLLPGLIKEDLQDI